MFKQWMMVMAAFGVGAGSSASAAKKPQQVLVVVSSQTMLTLREGALYPTGYYLNELTVPVKHLVEAGYQVTFANPNGNPPSLDAHSVGKQYFNNDEKEFAEVKRFHDGLTQLRHPRKLADVLREGLDQYAAVFVPGGHAPMEDLLQDAELGQVLRHFHERGKPTALICHGPIAILSALPNAKDYVSALNAGDTARAKTLANGWIYAGYKMTIFSTAEEQVAEGSQLGGKVRFYPDFALQTAGGNVEVAAPWKSQVVRDRELLTGQNPFSDEELARQFIGMLTEAPVR